MLVVVIIEGGFYGWLQRFDPFCLDLFQGL